MYRILAVGLVVLAASACGPLVSPPRPTEDNSDEVATLNVMATTVAHSATATAEALTSAPSVTETPAPDRTRQPEGTATPVENERQEAILILSPGIASAVTSPVLVSGQADPTFEQTLVVQITDANGDALTTVPIIIAADVGQRGPFEADVQFSVPADQPGRISVYSASARDGGLTHLASVEVTLLAGGAANILPAEARPESIQIDSPTLLAVASGGVLHLTGFSDYVFESNLGVMLCGEGGSGDPHPICGTVDNLLVATNVLIQTSEIGVGGPFETAVAYSVAQSTHARVVVFSASPRDGGIMHLASQEIVLEP